MKLKYTFNPNEEDPARRLTKVELVPEDETDKDLLKELRKQALNRQDIYEWVLIPDAVKMRKKKTPELPMIYKFANAAYL